MGTGYTHTAHFPEQPVISIYKSGVTVKEKFDVVHETKWLGRPHRETTYTIPAGYHCDSASIAPIFRGIVSKFNACNAGIVHDYMYGRAIPNRADADRIFYLLLRQTAMNAVSCFLAYAAVRVFGRLYYGNNTIKEKQT